ncbi:MAG: phenylalanyl-tRNA synthetase alpha chain [Parcubacteria group bacterium Gr01-1014_33]|nr:MAG: phenylalanyl-tRNA synthetase alpha chain [Parcubacteria group bacterium Gr01-1014_33]
MQHNLIKIRENAEKEISDVVTRDALETTRIQYLGRSGALTAILRSIKELPEDERRKVGEEANHLRVHIEHLLEEKRAHLERTNQETILQKEWIDVTRPGIRIGKGHLHPITKIRREIEAIFISMGFGVVEGPEVELEHYNFDALNLPETHPAREMQDTWWLEHNLKERYLLRTQVTAIQVRFMEKNNPPFRIIMPGVVYRREATDTSHEIQFTQMDGLVVDKKVSLADLKGIMETVLKRLFGDNIKTRLRAGYFPFVEPGVEMDIECLYCRQKGCSLCKQSGWIEVFPGGIVHPHVFKTAGYNSKDWQGIAWDIGVDRIAILKYKIPDLRLLRSGDLRFLRQF